MEEGFTSSLRPPRHRKRSGDNSETPTRSPALRPDAVRGRGEDSPAEDVAVANSICRQRPSPPRLPNPRFPSLNKTSHHNAPSAADREPPRQRQKKKVRQEEEEEEEEEKEEKEKVRQAEEEEEKEAMPLRPPSSPLWNLRSRRRPTSLPFRPLPDRDNPLPIKKASPMFSFALSKAEIKNDFLLITRESRRRPKKRRPRSIQHQLDSLFPGEFLSKIRRDSWWDSWDDISLTM